MKTCAKSKNTINQHCPFEYVIQVYSADGRLLSECLVDAIKHQIPDIKGAEAHARNTPAIARFGRSIVIVSSEYADSLDQVHAKMSTKDSW